MFVFCLMLNIQGIGRDTAKMLANLGAQVIAVSRTQADLDSLQAEVSMFLTIGIDF